MMKRLLTLAAISLVASACGKRAEVSLANIFTEHMVLQRSAPVKLRGSTEPGAKVNVEWLGTRYKTVADTAGKWFVELAPAEAGGPYTLKVNSLILNDILVGDVYLASGQSNMELPVRRCLDDTGETVAGYSNPNIRYVAVPCSFPFTGPAEDIGETRWQVLDSDSSTMEWSAVCYFTARALQKENPEVPIGFINSSLGGSGIECWMREEILPERFETKLRPYKDKALVDSILYFNSRIYTDWQEALDKAARENGGWAPADLFSDSWSKDEKGPVYGKHLFRTTLTLTAGQAKGPAILNLGTMADSDSSFVNGQYVGSTGYFYPPRKYSVPEGLLKEGANTIEIHLFAAGDEPIRFVQGKTYSLKTSAGEISLLNGWEHRLDKRMPKRPREIFLRWMPSVLWNGMIAPIKDFRSAGVVWYQGEANVDHAEDYGALLESLTIDWREQMDSPGLPFYIIELAAYQGSRESDRDWGWNRIQKEQKRACERLQGVFFVPNGDIGEDNDIHPQCKDIVGGRVAETITSNK